MSLGLALSGGGIKGAAHIGVLKALEEENRKMITKGTIVIDEGELYEGHSCISKNHFNYKTFRVF